MDVNEAMKTADYWGKGNKKPVDTLSAIVGGMNVDTNEYMNQLGGRDYSGLADMIVDNEKAPRGSQYHRDINTALNRPEKVQALYRGKESKEALHNTGRAYKTPGANDLIVIQDRGNPISEGLTAIHEVDHTQREDNATRLEGSRYYENNVKSKLDKNTRDWYKYASTKEEMDARYAELFAAREMMKFPGTDFNTHKKLKADVLDNLELFRHFGDSYGKARKDYDPTVYTDLVSMINKRME